MSSGSGIPRITRREWEQAYSPVSGGAVRWISVVCGGAVWCEAGTSLLSGEWWGYVVGQCIVWWEPYSRVSSGSV